ncbi:MAG: methylmalonyl Co-A mutase-associated GTPase MeaB [Desulfobacteraceae bacterium]|jgi:LAO/AO transport system kinase|nr:methylmalonyl Co-A mutase-associated GTPase MeaB [Desulfobacteraceae bacterium]
MEKPKTVNNSWNSLVAWVLAGKVRAMARMITRVEDREPGWKDAMKAIYSASGSAKVIGITGPPGAGKSSLTCEIAQELVRLGQKVGIIAVDPTSPFTGGSLLGDRLRMKKIFTTKEVFIRSMATRGMLGGLSHAARDVARIMDASGKDIILIETVGVGQDEIEVVKAADLVMMVCIPGQGDGIQALKAGVMEIADIFIINKADLPGADEVMADIGSMLALSSETGHPIPPVLKTSALKSHGIRDLVATLLTYQTEKNIQDFKRENQAKEEILSLMENEVFRSIHNRLEQSGELSNAVRQMIDKKKDPYSIVTELLQQLDGKAYLFKA